MYKTIVSQNKTCRHCIITTIADSHQWLSLVSLLFTSINSYYPYSWAIIGIDAPSHLLYAASKL